MLNKVLNKFIRPHVIKKEGLIFYNPVKNLFETKNYVVI